MRYVHELVSVLLSHNVRWWGSLAVSWVAGVGIFNPQVSAFLQLHTGFALPNQSPGVWLVYTLLAWLIASLVHREVIRKLKAGRITFGEPFVRRGVPLYQTVGINSVQIATNDLVSIDVLNHLDGGKEITRAFCTVAVYRRDGATVLEFEHPRWAENSKPGYAGSPPDRYPQEWNYRDLVPHGGKNEINFIVRPHDEEAAYGFQGASQRGHRWCNPALKIPLGDYLVRLTVQGVGMIVAAETWVRLCVVVTEERVHIESIKPPKWSQRGNRAERNIR
jgi:hypothetical protein